MKTLYSLLAVPEWLSEDARWIAIAVVAVIGVIALVVGVVKGFTHLGWGALIWAGACALFYLLEVKLDVHDNNPLLKMGAVEKLDPGVQSFISTLSIALVSVLGALVVFGILALIFRPKKRRKAVGLRYAGKEDDDDYYGYDDEKPKVCVVNRIFGGLIALVNTALVLAAVACLALVICDVTPLRTGALQSVFESGFIDRTWQYIHAYTLDFIFIALIAAITYGGYRMGAARGLRPVILTFAFIAAIVCAFWLPFSKLALEGASLSFLGKISGYFTGLMGSLPEKAADAIGKVICGLIVCVVFCIAVGIVGLLLKLLANAMRKIPALRFVDGVISTVIMMAVGVLVCALIAAVLYTVEYYGAFKGSSLFESSSPLLSGLYDFFDEYLRPLLERLNGALN